MVVRTAITPAYGDAAMPGVLDGIEDQVLGNTTNLDRIAVGGEPRRSFTAQKQPMMLRQRANALAELLEYRRDVDRFDLALLAAGFQQRKTRHVIEQMMQRRHVPHQDTYEIVLGPLVQRSMCEPHRGISHDAEIAAQIMCGLPPEVGALLFQFLDVGQSAFEIPDMPRGLLLLKLEVLADALFNSGAAQRGPYAASRRDHGMRDLRVRGGIPVQFGHHAFVELAELAGDLTQVIALLPALQSVGGRRLLCGILGRCRSFGGRMAQPALERRE